MSEDNQALKIVVIDDSDFSRKGIIEILEGEGYDIVGEAGNAKNALGLINSANAELYIIDIVMPDVSGIELAKNIAEKSMGAYIIMISSLGIEQLVIESISNGAVDFLQKPFEREDLLTSVGKIAEIHAKGGF